MATNTQRPIIDGTPLVGQRLTTRSGVWTGITATSVFKWKWELDGVVLPFTSWECTPSKAGWLKLTVTADGTSASSDLVPIKVNASDPNPPQTQPPAPAPTPPPAPPPAPVPTLTATQKKTITGYVTTLGNWKTTLTNYLKSGTQLTAVLAEIEAVRTRLRGIVASSGTGGGGGGATFDGPAELPRSTPTSTVPTSFATDVTTSSLSDLNTKIADAVAQSSGNHRIKIPVAASYSTSNSIMLPNRTAGSGWIVICSENHASLPARDTRINIAGDLANMPLITTTAVNTPAFITENNSHHYWFLGLEVTASAHQQNGLFELGEAAETVAANQASYIAIDRCYLRGGAMSTASTRRGIALNCSNATIIDSYLSNFIHPEDDTQCIQGSNGAGVYLIQNNYLSAGGENIMFGGSDPAISGQTPSDMTIRRNFFTHDSAWYSNVPQSDLGIVKHLFELKLGVRILVEGNVMEKHWYGDETGYAVNINNINQRNASWTTTSDVTFRYNIVRDSPAGIKIVPIQEGELSNFPDTPAARFSVHDNLFYDIGKSSLDTGVEDPVGIMFLTNSSDQTPLFNSVTFKNNSCFMNYTAGNSKAIGFGSEELSNTLVLTDNVMQFGEYGIIGDGTGEGTASLNAYWDPYTVTGNLWIGSYDGNTYPSGNNIEANLAAAGVNATTYQITGTYAGKGCNFSTLDTQTFGVKTAGASSLP